MLLLYCLLCFFFFFKQKTAYEMRISDWSSDVCSSDLSRRRIAPPLMQPTRATSRNVAPMPPLFGLAPGGVYRAACRCRRRGALLPHPFDLADPKTDRKSVV